MIPGGTAKDATGTQAGDIELQLDGLNWGNSVSVSDIELSDVQLDGEALTAVVSGQLAGIVEGDIAVTCNSSGERALVRDTDAPEVVSFPPSLAALTPIQIFFDEPVDAAAQFTVSQSDEVIPTESRLDMVSEDLIWGVTLEPLQAWPGGELQIEIEDAVDAGGNALDREVLSVDVPEWVSVTTNPSFEEPITEDGPWFGCVAEGAVEYRDWGEEADVVIEPSDGESLAICYDNGVVLQGFVDPPEGATEVFIDVAEVDFSLGASGGEIAVYANIAGSMVELEAQGEDPEDDTPVFRTYAAPIDAASDGFWLIIEHNGGTYEWGEASGAALVDNMRFD